MYLPGALLLHTAVDWEGEAAFPRVALPPPPPLASFAFHGTVIFSENLEFYFLINSMHAIYKILIAGMFAIYRI